MRKCKFFDNKKWLTKDKKSENTYQNVLAGFIYYWRIYFLSTQSTFKQTFTSMYFFCTFFISKSLFSIKTKCLKKCLKSRIFTLLVVVATLHIPHSASVRLKRFGWTWIRHVSQTSLNIQRFAITVSFRRILLTLRHLSHGHIIYFYFADASARTSSDTASTCGAFVGLKRFGWTLWGLAAFYQQTHTLNMMRLWDSQGLGEPCED